MEVTGEEEELCCQTVYYKNRYQQRLGHVEKPVWGNLYLVFGGKF